MPVPIHVLPEKNLWIAAGDGDIPRVRELIELHSMSPNDPDENTYTPMHAAASYGQIEMLEYLLSEGGDVNLTDEDGDTPLYTVEDVRTARWLVEHGAVVDRRNVEGISPAEHLAEEFPEVAAYLESVSPSGVPSTTSNSIPSTAQPSQHAQNVASENLTTSLMQSVQEIMERAEAEGRDPEEELRRVVGRTVLEGVAAGYDLSAAAGQSEERREQEEPRVNGVKRRRREDGPG